MLNYSLESGSAPDEFSVRSHVSLVERTQADCRRTHFVRLSWRKEFESHFTGSVRPKKQDESMTPQRQLFPGPVHVDRTRQCIKRTTTASRSANFLDSLIDGLSLVLSSRSSITTRVG